MCIQYTADLERNLKLYISGKFPGNIDASGPQTTHWLAGI